MVRLLLFVFYTTAIYLTPNYSFSLVGIDENKTNKNNNIETKKKDTNSNNNKKKENKKSKGLLQTGEKPENIPDFPNDGEKEYKMLFNENFSNVVDDSFQDGEEWDIFINQEASNDINKKYISGNNEEPSQIEVIEAEKKTMFDKIILDKDNITTHRKRVMAYLTLDQMLFAGILDQKPHGYYVNAMNKSG